MTTSEIQSRQQAYGPHRPLVPQLISLLQMLPPHVEVQAVAINGQTGMLVIETRHDDGNQVYAFQEELLPSGEYRWEPTTEERE